MNKILFVFFVLLASTALAQTKIDYSASIGYGQYNISKKQIFYDPAPIGNLWNFMGISKNGGNTLNVGINAMFEPNNYIGLRSGLNVSYRNGYYQERIEGYEEQQFEFVTLGIPLQLVFLPKSTISFITGIETSILLSSGEINERLDWWAQKEFHANGIDQDMKMNLFSFTTSAGLLVHIWRFELTASYYQSLSPFLTTFSYKPTVANYEGDFKGKLDFHFGGYQVKLAIPLNFK